MANYGSPGGGPAEPWRGQRPYPGYHDHGAHRPAEPGSRHDEPQYAEPRYEEPRHDGYRYEERSRATDGRAGAVPQPTYDSGWDPVGGPVPYAGAPAPPRRRRRPLVVVLAVVALLVLAGGSALYLLADGNESPSVAAPTSAAPTASADPDVPVPTGPATAAAPESSADPRFAKVGQCVRDAGTTDGKPKLLISSCTSNTYEVLRRFDGTTSGEKDAEAKCGRVQGYTNWFFYDSELDTLDFVLCLKQR